MDMTFTIILSKSIAECAETCNGLKICVAFVVASIGGGNLRCSPKWACNQRSSDGHLYIRKPIRKEQVTPARGKNPICYINILK